MNIKASNINAFWVIDSSSRDNAWWRLLIRWNLLPDWLYCGVVWQYHQWGSVTLTHTLFLLFCQMSYHCVLWISTHFQHCQTQLHIYCNILLHKFYMFQHKRDIIRLHIINDHPFLPCVPWLALCGRWNFL